MNSKEFKITFQARWADMDLNGHMRNTAYLDYAADSRMLYFKENGFAMSDFIRLSIGPVVFQDTIRYFHELFMYEDFTVTLRLKGLSADGSKFHFVNDFQKSDGTPVASVMTEACWLDLNRRIVSAPPETLRQIIEQLQKTDDFGEITRNGKH